MIQGVLLDLSGVLYTGAHAIPGSVEAVARLRNAGLPVRFLTNSTRMPRRKILAKIRKFGFDVAEDELFTPAKAACDALVQRNMQAHLLIHPALAEDFEDLPRGRGDVAVVVGDAAEHFTYDAMNAAFRALDGGAELWALAANRSFTDDDGLRSIDVGAFVHALEYSSGVTAKVLGKPAAAYFHAAAESMSVAPEASVMIGDDAEADVSGALAAGVGTAILVRTGKYAPGEEHAYSPHPSQVADDLAQAVDWILMQSGAQM